VTSAHTPIATEFGAAQYLTLRANKDISHQKTAGLIAAASGSSSSCSEEPCGLFGELFRKLEVRAVPGIRVKDQPGIR
jgi:hypothetical protein